VWVEASLEELPADGVEEGEGADAVDGRVWVSRVERNALALLVDRGRPLQKWLRIYAIHGEIRTERR
jgi:hypothetical protein